MRKTTPSTPQYFEEERERDRDRDREKDRRDGDVLEIDDMPLSTEKVSFVCLVLFQVQVMMVVNMCVTCTPLDVMLMT